MENRGFCRKTIKKVLSKKMNHFLESIEDENVKKLVKENTIITGGAIASMLLGEKINDFDLYFTNKKTVIAVSEYYVKKFVEKHGKPNGSVLVLHADHPLVKEILDVDLIKSGEIDEELVFNSSYDVSYRIAHSIKETFTNDINRVKLFFTGSWGADGETDTGFEDEVDSILEHESELSETETDYNVSFISANAITLTDKVQLVIRFFGDAEEIHSNYDFIHVTNFWTFKENNLVTNTAALESLMAKRLVYQGSKYPLASIFRAKKFITRGWNINAGQYLKMAFQLNDLDLKDPYTLEEQLTGVDLIYFSAILDDLRNKKHKDDSFEPTTEYFLEIVSRIFD